MSRTSLILASGFLLAWSLQATTSTVIYDNTGQTPGGSDAIDGLGPLHDSFSTGSNAGSLIRLELLLVGGVTSPGSFSVGLYADDNTAPGALIANLANINDSSLTAGLDLIDVALTAHPFLSSGTRYWISLTGNGASRTGWSFTTSTSGIGVSGEFLGNQANIFPNTEGPYQMEAVLTPEPFSSVLSACAVAALALLRRRTNA